MYISEEDKQIFCTNTRHWIAYAIHFNHSNYYPGKQDCSTYPSQGTTSQTDQICKQEAGLTDVTYTTDVKHFIW